MTDDKARITIEIAQLRAVAARLIGEFMAATCKEDAAAINDQIKTTAARIAELEMERTTISRKDFVKMFKGR